MHIILVLLEYFRFSRNLTPPSLDWATLQQIEGMGRDAQIVGREAQLLGREAQIMGHTAHSAYLKVNLAIWWAKLPIQGYSTR